MPKKTSPAKKSGIKSGKIVSNQCSLRFPAAMMVFMVFLRIDHFLQVMEFVSQVLVNSMFVNSQFMPALQISAL